MELYCEARKQEGDADSGDNSNTDIESLLSG